MVEALAGPDPCDPWSLPAPRTVGTRPGGTLRGLRIGYIETFHNHLVSREVIDNTPAVLGLLTQRGAIEEDVTDDIDWIEYERRVM